MKEKWEEVKGKQWFVAGFLELVRLKGRSQGSDTQIGEISGVGKSPHPEIPKAKILEVSVWLIWWQTLTWNYFYFLFLTSLSEGSCFGTRITVLMKNASHTSPVHSKYLTEVPFSIKKKNPISRSPKGFR